MPEGPALPVVPPLPADPAALLEQALEHTRSVLVGLARRDDARLLDLPTPCAGWDLGQLLAHMDDSLDTFAEGAAGAVSLDPRLPADVRVEALCRKSSHLLGLWAGRRPAAVSVAGHLLPEGVVALAASLEVAVHGWDVARALARAGSAPSLPDTVARDLLAVVPLLVAAEDRGVRFAAPLPVPPRADLTTRLLAALGRDRFRPLGANTAVRRTGGTRAS